MEVMALLSQPRQRVLKTLKELGGATIPQLSERLGVSTEAVRQLLVQLSSEGWIETDCGGDEDRGESRPLGRPALVYCLTLAGNELFAKQYEHLAISLVDRSGEEALANLTDDRVAPFRSSLTPAMSLEEKMEKLRAVYGDDDPYVEIEQASAGPRLIETNCPFLAVALERPVICSTTVSMLRRLLGYEIVREERFQDDDGRCAFQVYLDRPLSVRAQRLRFELEPPKDHRDEAPRH